MSEQILKALMQLFAIISRPESHIDDRKNVVHSFLSKQINQELIEEYLKIFEYYYGLYQKKQKEKGMRAIPLSSVRVLKICTEINEELTQQQKIIVVVQLLEFVKSDNVVGNEITEQELIFIETVADTFFISRDKFEQIKEFILYSFDKIPVSENIMIIDNKKEHYEDIKTKHIFSENLQGQIRVLNVDIANVYLIRYIGESEMYLNNQLLPSDKVSTFKTGSSIRNRQIKPIYFSDIVTSFIEDKLKSKIVFEARKIGYKFKDGNIGLREVNFSEESGRLVGIMGASGSGKSTLLNSLNGNNRPTKGEVLINGINIHTEKDKVEGLIGHVPQDDLLIEELTVFQNLYYNAKLCFDNLTEEEIVERVLETLRNLGLFEIRDIQVGNPLNQKISGGQRKRLNIALELIREPAILFLDEPTSGLSSKDSENILDLLKELTLKGKLVFVVIHQPSSDIFKMFDRLIILDTGGYLIYNGDPIESITYFKSRVHHANWSESECHCCGNVNPEQVFNIVEANVLDEYGNLTPTRKISPKEWSRYFDEFSKEKGSLGPSIDEVHPEDIPDITFKIPNRFKQFLVFIKRDVLSKLTNTQYLIINLLEAPLLAFLLAFITKYYDVSNESGYIFFENCNFPVFIFMSVIVAIFIGLTVSAEEIIKDRKIQMREEFLNLSWSSYLLSKVTIMFAISAIQALTFVLLGNSIMEIKGMYWQFWLVLFSAWASSNVMGLVISDSFKTVVTIYIIIPFLVIPQLILSGIIVKYEELNPLISSPNKIPFYGEVMTARWAYEALAVYQFMENDYEEKFYRYDKAMSEAEFKKDYWIPKVRNKINYCSRNIDKPEKKNDVIKNLELIRNEIAQASKENPTVKFNAIDALYYNKLSEDVFTKLDEYLKLLNKYQIKRYNKANKLKDGIITDMQDTPEGKEAFLNLKREHHNERLEEFVTNSNEMDRIIEFKNSLYQKIDPIYKDPDAKFIKAHFYAPRKLIGRAFYSTFWINIIVIWIMTILLYVILYYRLLKKALDFMEQIDSKIKRLRKA